MKYKEILEEQIKVLQERQAKANTLLADEACKIAITIADLADRIKNEGR